MNLKGSANYSRETVGLRQTSQISNQQFKLICAYPLLFSDIINDDIKTKCRLFLTISFLKEIIVSNSLNIINMASQLPAPNTQQSSTAQMIGNAILSSQGYGYNQQAPMTISNYNNYEVQNRVNEKTKLIKKHLESDTRTKKLMPHVEIVTLNNLIDVPVVVGTKGFDVSTTILLYVLAISVAGQTSLDNLTNVNNVFRMLKTNDERTWYKIIENLSKSSPSLREQFVNWLSERHPTLRNTLQRNRITRYLLRKVEGNKSENQQTRETQQIAAENPNETNPLFNILKLMKNDLNDANLSFRFVLDSDMLRSQLGIDTSNNTMETTITTLSNNQRQIFMQMRDKYMELVSVQGSLMLISVFNTLSPVAYQDPQTGEYYGNTQINFLELKQKHFDARLLSDLGRSIDNLSSGIKSSLGSITPKDAQVKINLVKSLCQSMAQVDRIIEDEFYTFNGKVIQTNNFTDNQLNDFVGGLDRLASSFGSMIKRFENVFGQLVNNGLSLLKIVRTQIYSSVENFLKEIVDRPNYQSNMSFLFGVNDDDILRNYVPQVKDAIFTVFYFFFLYRLQAAVCQYIDVIDVEIESRVHDVFDFPNYTLVIPIDMLLGIHASYVSRNFNELVRGENLQPAKSFNDNYVRGMIKFLCNRIKIPSIMVVDDARKIIHYQFMYMSSPERISYSSLDAFIRSGVN